MRSKAARLRNVGWHDISCPPTVQKENGADVEIVDFKADANGLVLIAASGKSVLVDKESVLLVINAMLEDLETGR